MTQTIRLKTARDGANEIAVATELANLTGYTVSVADRNGAWNPYDLVIESRWGTLALVELKCRAVNHDDYYDAPVSHLKLTRLLEAADQYHCPAVFLIQYRDRLRWINARRIGTARAGVIRRTKPRASGKTGAHDTEFGYFVPQDWFNDIDTLRGFLGHWDIPSAPAAPAGPPRTDTDKEAA